MLVATHSISKQIRLYRVEVDWPAQRFNIEHVKTIINCSPSNEDAGEGGIPASLLYPEAQLYHLELASPAPDIRNKETFPPLLIAFFGNTPHHNDHPSIGNAPSTSIARWELNSIKPSLPSGFSQLASKRGNGSNTGELQVGERLVYGLHERTLTLPSRKWFSRGYKISRSTTS